MTPHHGSSEQDDLRRRFLQQVEGTARREWTQGRLSADDDGTLAMAFATDLKKRVIIIRFGKPTEWIGLDLKTATDLRDQLDERILQLRGITK